MYIWHACSTVCSLCVCVFELDGALDCVCECPADIRRLDKTLCMYMPDIC